MDLNETVVPETGGALHILDSSGDIKLTWDPDRPDEVAAVREQYDSFRRKGYDAFRVDKRGEPAARMSEFDPDARAIIMAPRPRGG